MQWTAVESSQIAGVGYDLDTETLGILFKPTKKQAEAEEAGSVYHYANVTPQMCADLINAESVGKYFGDNIKKHPETYPYTKVS